MNLKRVKQDIGLTCGLLGVDGLVDGLLFIRKTSSVVAGSDFSTRIARVNELNLFTVWLVLFALWRLIPNGESNPAHNT